MVKVRLINLKENLRISEIDSDALPSDFKRRINDFQARLTELCFEHQRNRIGIRNIGNTIRYDSEINDIFNDCFLKATRNNSELIQFFLASLKACNSDSIAFLYFSEDFRETSKVVDNSSISTSHWIQMIELLREVMEFKNLEVKQVYLLEILSLPNHQFIEANDSKFSRIIELK